MEDIAKKSDLHSDMIKDHLNLNEKILPNEKIKFLPPNQKIKKWKIVIKLYSDIINKDFDEKVKEVDTLEEDLEQSLILVEFLPNLLQLCQLFH